MTDTENRRSHRLHAVRQARRASRSARRCCRRRARSASISIRSAAGAPSAGAARSPSAKANSPSTASARSISHLSEFSNVEQRYDDKRGLLAGPPAVLPDQAPGRCRSSTCRPRARCTSRWCASAPRRAPSKWTRRPGSTSSRWKSRTCTSPPPTSSASTGRSTEQWELDERLLRPRHHAEPAEDAAPGRVEDHRAPSISRAARRRQRRLIAIWPGFHDKAFGLAIDVGSTTIAAHLYRSVDRRGRRLLRPHEPADPLRRRSDEPRLLCDDESGRREGNDGGRARGAQHARAAGRRAKPGSSSADILEDRAGRQSGHAPPVPRHRSDRTRRRALRARHRPCRSPGRRASSTSSSIPAPMPMCCPASPAMSAPIRQAWCFRKSPQESEDNMLVVDVGTNAEIVLGSKQRLLACSSPTGPAFEGAQISCGQRAAPGAIERIRIDPETLEPRYRVIGSRSVVGRAGLRGSGRRDRRHRHLRLGHHRGDRGNVSRRHHQPGRPGRWLARGAIAAHPARTSAPSTMWCARASRFIADHPERRARHPARQGGALCRRAPADGQARHRSCRPHPARRRLRQPYRRQIRDDPRPHSRLPARQGAVGRQCRGHGRPHRASQLARRATRSSRWCGASRRSRRRSSRKFQQHFVEAMAIPHKTAVFANLAQGSDPAGAQGHLARTRWRRAAPAPKELDGSTRLSVSHLTHGAHIPPPCGRG